MLNMTSNKVNFLNQMIGECDSKQTNKMHCSVLKISFGLFVFKLCYLVQQCIMCILMYNLLESNLF